MLVRKKTAAPVDRDEESSGARRPCRRKRLQRHQQLEAARAQPTARESQSGRRVRDEEDKEKTIQANEKEEKKLGGTSATPGTTTGGDKI
jgi:hypothetical protein